MTTPSLHTCPACAGFVPVARPTCPHCEATLAPPASRTRRLARMLGAMVSAGTLAVTLMACYGAMPHHGEYANHGCEGGDMDGDTSCAPQDCNDGDPTVYPGAQDPDLDTVDQNCDGIDGWRDPDQVAEPVAPEPTPVATDPAPAPTP